MTHRNVETLIGKLATDAGFRRRFAEDPGGVLAELRDHGIDLTDIELEALASTSADAIQTFAETVDRRIRKADFRNHPALTQD